MLTSEQAQALDQHFRAATAPFTFTQPVDAGDLAHVQALLASTVPGWTVLVRLLNPTLVTVDAFCDGVSYYYRLYMRVL